MTRVPITEHGRARRVAIPYCWHPLPLVVFDRRRPVRDRLGDNMFQGKVISPSLIGGLLLLALAETGGATAAALPQVPPDAAGNTGGALETAAEITIGAPQASVAQDGNADVVLTWPTVLGATSYEVQYGTVSDSLNESVQLPPAANKKYPILHLTNGQTYYFSVKAVNSQGTVGAPSITVVGTPASPPILKGAANATSSAAALSWTVVPGATRYQLSRRPSPTSPWLALASTSESVQQYTDTSIPPNTSYSYAVKAFFGNVGGAYSRPVSVSINSSGLIAPGNLSAQAGNAQVSLAWNRVPNATGYVILQKDANGRFVPLKSGGVTSTTSFTVTNLTNNIPYIFEVYATGTGGIDSPPSSSVTATPTAPPQTGTPVVDSVAVGDGTVTLTWVAVSNFTSYVVLERNSSDGYVSLGTNVNISKNPNGTYSATITGLVNGVTYSFEVATTSSGGQGPVSQPVSATPVPGHSATGTYSISQPTTHSGGAISPYYVGLSYEKPNMLRTAQGKTWLFSGSNSSLIAALKELGPGVLRLGAKGVDKSPYNPLDFTTSTVYSTATQRMSVNLKWTADPNAAHYQVLRIVAPAPATVVDSYASATIVATSIEASPAPTFTDTSVVNGVIYDYELIPYDSAGRPVKRTISKNWATTGAPPGLINVEAIAADGSVTVAWPTSINVPVSDYYVFRSETGQKVATQVAHVTVDPSQGKTSYSFVDSNVTNRNTYSYYVVAANTIGSGNASNLVSATPEPGLTAVSVGELAPDLPSNVHPADIDQLAAFLSAAGWEALYGIDFRDNQYTPSRVADEAAYVSQAMQNANAGLLGFEIGNEPDFYHSWFPGGGTYSLDQFLNQWSVFQQAVADQVVSAHLTGPGNCCHFSGNNEDYPAAFARKFGHPTANPVSLMTAHYYNGNQPETIANLFIADPGLAKNLGLLSTAAGIAGTPFRVSESNSYHNGGVPGVSDSYASALWLLDFLMQSAQLGSTGVNLHGGGHAVYSPIYDNGIQVTDLRPEYYAAYLFSTLRANGNASATSQNSYPFDGVSAAGSNLAAVSVYAVNTTVGKQSGTNVLLNNKGSAPAVVTLQLPFSPTHASSITLSNPHGASANLTVLADTSDGNAALNGTRFVPGMQQAITPTIVPIPAPSAPGAYTLTVTVPMYSAMAVYVN